MHIWKEFRFYKCEDSSVDHELKKDSNDLVVVGSVDGLTLWWVLVQGNPATIRKWIRIVLKLYWTLVIMKIFWEFMHHRIVSTKILVLAHRRTSSYVKNVTHVLGITRTNEIGKPA
jgi:hypothetical protein